MAKNKAKISLREATHRVLSKLDSQISFQEIVKKILKIRPSNAKKFETSIRNHLRYQEAGKSLIFLKDEMIVPIEQAVRGINIRLVLRRDELIKQRLPLDLFYPLGFFHQGADQLSLIDRNGSALPISFAEGNSGGSIHDVAFDIEQWLKDNPLHQGDHLIIRIEDWKNKRFFLYREPASDYRPEKVRKRNQELADIFYDMLENIRLPSLAIRDAIVTAYARMEGPRGYPTDHWHKVIDEDSRLAMDRGGICYANESCPLDLLPLQARNIEKLQKFIAENFQLEPLPPETIIPEQGEQVYCFKASFRYRANIWRRIEIQGKQTLADLDTILRDAFCHDTADHLSGFWKRIKRGKSGKSFRDIDLGNVTPHKEGEAAGIQIATLKLQPEQQLKYVYDFGDWIDHRLVLEEIISPQKNIKYPRIAAKSKSNYRNCVHCKKNGKDVRATWICFECSQGRKRILVCDDCQEKLHEDHNVDELL